MELKLRLLPLPSELEALARWFAEDGAAEDECNYLLACSNLIYMPAPIQDLPQLSTIAISASPAWVPPLIEPQAHDHDLPQPEEESEQLFEPPTDFAEAEEEPAEEATEEIPSEETEEDVAVDTKGKKIIHVICKIMSSIIIALMVLAILVFLLPRFFGIELRAVLTASMEPVHNVGSVVVIRSTPFEDIQINNDITFYANRARETVVTHRVVARNSAARTLTTRGLTNQVDDAPVHAEYVIGVVWFSVPLVGYAIIWLEPLMHKVIAAIVIVAIWLVLFMVERAVSAAKKEKQLDTNTI